MRATDRDVHAYIIVKENTTIEVNLTGLHSRFRLLMEERVAAYS